MIFSAAALVFVLGQAGPASAWSSVRPPECSPLDAGRANNVWERAKAPKLRKYCDLLASGAAKLAGAAGMKNEVVALASDADKAMPGHAAPLVLKGRALAALDKFPDALSALREAKARDERALDDPLALFTWARVLAREGKLDEARVAYRELLPRSSMLALSDRSAASLEAGLLAMTSGPAGLDEAIAILRQAVREAQDIARMMSELGLALALDRFGEADEASALLEEQVHGDPRPDLASAGARELLFPAVASEAHALAALALEHADVPAAREAWALYLKDATSGPWAAHARAHLARLGGK